MVRPSHDAESAPNYHREQPEKKGSRFQHRSRLPEPDFAEEEERDHRSPGNGATDDQSYASARSHDAERKRNGNTIVRIHPIIQRAPEQAIRTRVLKMKRRSNSKLSPAQPSA